MFWLRRGAGSGARTATALLVVGASGCVSSAGPSKGGDVAVGLGSVPLTSTAVRENGAPPIRSVGLAFDVLRVSIPVFPGRHSLKVWNHVDVLRVDPELSGRLARNGLRVGVGGQDSWEPIRAIFEAARARSSQDQFPTQSGAPLLVELGSVGAGETIFRYGTDDRLAGRTFADGAKVIQIDYAYHPRFGGAVDLQLGFEIRRDGGELVWRKQSDGVIVQVPSVEHELFPELNVAVSLRSDEFLMLGPSEQAENEFLVGSRFLAAEGSGERWETVIILTPVVFQTQTAQREG